MNCFKFTFFVVFCCIFCCCSCNARDQKVVQQIKEFVSSTNKELPRELGEDALFERIEYDQSRNAVIAYFKFPYYSQPNVNTLASMKRNLLRSFIVTGLRPLAETVRENGGDIIWKVRGNNDKDYYDLICSNNELAYELDNNNQSHKDILVQAVRDMIITTNNSNLPFQADEYCVCSSLSEENCYLVYLYIVDENSINFDLYKDYLMSANELKQYLTESAKHDPIEKGQYSMLAEIGWGMINRYKGSLSGKVIDIKLTPQDMNEISK